MLLSNMWNRNSLSFILGILSM